MKKSWIFFIALVCLLFMAAAHPPAPFHNDSLWRIYDNGDVTKRLRFEANSISTDTTRTITMPDADVDLAIGALTPTNSYFVVGDGSAFVTESGDTARHSLGLGTADSPNFEDVIVRRDFKLTGGLDSDIIFYDGEVWKASIEWTDIGGLGLQITSVSGLINFVNEDLKTTGDLTDGTNSLSIAEAKAAHTHVSNNGSDHSYIDQDVTTTGTPDFNSITAYYQHWKNGIVVDAGGNLTEQYDWLKSADRDAAMGALSATNWRVLILGPGAHTVASTFTADTNYVAVVALSGNYKDTRLVGDFADAVVEQTANIIALKGFTVYQTDTTLGTPGTNAAIGFLVNVGAGDNDGSIYDLMYFDSASQNSFIGSITCGVFCNTAERGMWRDCHSTDFAWRVPDGGDFGPTMYYCTANDSSFGGDGEGSGNGTIKGSYYFCEGRDRCWGGCAVFGIDIDSTASFYFCVTRDNSWAIGKDCAGTFYSCSGRYKCFGGYASGAYYGTFSGKAYNCIAETASFGSGHASSKCSGLLSGVRLTGMTERMPLDGATIEDCYLQATGVNKHCVDLSSDTGTSKIYNSTLIANGTGNSIYAGAAKNVIAAHCRLNKSIHGNVTNLIGTPYNIDDTDIE